jgi:hypothetical protein
VKFVVQFHDLAGNGGLECAVVVCSSSISITKRVDWGRNGGDGHGRSGRVALPLMKLVLAADAALLEAPALSAERATADERKSVADIVADPIE